MKRYISYPSITSSSQTTHSISHEVKSALRRGIRVFYISDFCLEIKGYNEVICSTFDASIMKNELNVKHIEFITNSNEIKSIEFDNDLVYSIQRNLPSEIFIRRIN